MRPHACLLTSQALVKRFGRFPINSGEAGWKRVPVLQSGEIVRFPPGCSVEHWQVVQLPHHVPSFPCAPWPLLVKQQCPSRVDGSGVMLTWPSAQTQRVEPSEKLPFKFSFRQKRRVLSRISYPPLSLWLNRL